MTTGLTQIAGLLNAHLTQQKPKRINWSGKVKRLIKNHPELEIRIELHDKNQYGNWYYIYMRSDIEDEHFEETDLQECCNNMEGVFDQLIARLDWLKEERR
ncbi:MAG TPA: hypothetical protein DG048_24835 [Pseudoalteromonas sp.]|nr:hypothetical protein [Pseudoalteromonas sp.]|tara:strand:+ start:393 stop:695 length:303 start_codon:yes stop_codon:yes gene_type:complete